MLVTVLAAVALAACGVAADDRGIAPGEDSPPADTGAGMGSGLSIEEAMASDAEGPLLVNGFIVRNGDEIRLCSAVAESFPPQCGGASLLVEGDLDLDQFATRTEGDVTWTDGEIQLLGEVEGGVITVTEDRSA